MVHRDGDGYGSTIQRAVAAHAAVTFHFRDAEHCMPRVDVFEQNGSLVFKAELPGIKKEDIAVTMEDGCLVFRGTRNEESEVKEDKYYRVELSSGSYYRRLPLPDGIQPEQVAAEYKDGVLEVKVPKANPAQPTPTKINFR